MDANAPPLQDITVVDLTQIYNGPYATFLMAMAGARIIKVEPPGGEHLRQRGIDRGSSLPFALLNSNKHPITLDLKTAAGRELLLDMAAHADVLVENFSPGTMDRLELGWDILRRVNPRLIYAASSGFGQTGPNRDYPAMDLTIQAFSGVMSVTGYPDRPPVKAGPAICDFTAGVHLYGAIVTALYQRTKTGQGRFVEVSMQEAIYASLSSNLGLHHGGDPARPPRTGNRHGGLAEAPYNVYAAFDGYIAVICPGDRAWQALCEAMERPNLAADPRFLDRKSRVQHIEEVDTLVGAWTATRTRQAVFETLMRHHVPSAPVRGLDEVIADQHMHSRGALLWVDHPEFGRIVVPRSPMRFAGVPLIEIIPSASLGAANEAVLSEWLGLSAEAIRSLEQEGVI